MSDIVERLRHAVEGDGESSLLRREAADEIEQLRKALADILRLEILPEVGAGPLSDAGGIAYRALRK